MEDDYDLLVAPRSLVLSFVGHGYSTCTCSLGLSFFDIEQWRSFAG